MTKANIKIYHAQYFVSKNNSGNDDNGIFIVALINNYLKILYCLNIWNDKYFFHLNSGCIL